MVMHWLCRHRVSSNIHVVGSHCTADLVSLHVEAPDHLLWVLPALCSSDQTPTEISGVVNRKIH